MFVTRHGITKDNENAIISGWRPGELSEVGKAQMERVAMQLRDVHIDVIYSSDLARCRDSVAIINTFHNAPVEYLELLRELSSGEFDGRVAADMQAALREHKGERDLFEPEGGESMVAFRERVLQFRTFLARESEKFKDKTILICSHSTWVRIFLELDEMDPIALELVEYIDPQK